MDSPDEIRAALYFTMVDRISLGDRILRVTSTFTESASLVVGFIVRLVRTILTF